MQSQNDTEENKRPSFSKSVTSGTSHIGEDIHYSGEITGRGNLLLAGRFSGKIDLPDNCVTVEKSGTAQAEVNSRDIIIEGKFEGNVHASGKVEIRSSASMTGNIFASRISIEDGAQFKGSVKMKS